MEKAKQISEYNIVLMLQQARREMEAVAFDRVTKYTRDLLIDSAYCATLKALNLTISNTREVWKPKN
jgi:hypothetical protein